MRNRRKTASAVLLGTITIFWVVGLAAPAGAEVFQGGCTGSATFSDGTTVTESTPLSEVVVVPEADSVIYAGSINLPPPDDEVPFAGGITVQLPRFGWTVVDWADETKEVSDAGTYAYEVPGFVPRGIQLEVSASHTQLTMKLAGDPGAAALIGATGTVVFLAATIGAGVKKKVA